MERKANILIVDDDPGMTETMADILDDMGYNVGVAGDGYKAIEMARGSAYDVALIDVKMPGINGVETFKEVKRISPSTKSILMTAYSVEDLLKEALGEGAYGIIYKPLDIDRVVDIIEKAIKGVLILAVDDDPNTCKALKDVLEEKDYRACVAYSGEEAVKLARENSIDIVFIDVKMPVLNGLETYLAIKEVNTRVTAVMMTGYRQETKELVGEAIRSNAYTCLYKPLNMDEVVVLIEEIHKQKLSGTLRKDVQGGR